MRLNNKILFIGIIFFSLTLSAAELARSLAIVVSEKNPIDRISLATLQALYLGMTEREAQDYVPESEMVLLHQLVPIDAYYRNTTFLEFHATVTFHSFFKMSKHWSKRPNPDMRPDILDPQENVADFIKKNENAIGYVSKAHLPIAGLKSIEVYDGERVKNWVCPICSDDDSCVQTD